MLAGVVFLAAVGFLSGWLWPGAKIGPRLEVSPDFDVGELVYDQELTLAIGFRNIGDEPLHLDPPIPGCQCALATLGQTVYAPGEMGRFQFTLRPAAPPGASYEQAVVVPSNDPESPRRIVTIRGRMRGSLISQPARVQVGSLKPDESWSGSVVVACTDPDAEFGILSVRCDLPEVEVGTPTPTQRPEGWTGPYYSLPVQVMRMERVGKHVGKIEIATNHARYAQLAIPLEIEVISRVKIQPRSLLLEGPNSRTRMWS